MNHQSARICLFYCATSIEPVEIEQVFSKRTGEIKFIPLPCSGKTDILYLTKAFETGAEGVAVVTCPQGECRYLEGNLRAIKRVEAIDALLEEIGLGKGRLAIIEKSEGGIPQIIRQVEEFQGRIQALSEQVSKDTLNTPVP